MKGFRFYNCDIILNTGLPLIISPWITYNYVPTTATIVMSHRYDLVACFHAQNIDMTAAKEVEHYQWYSLVHLFSSVIKLGLKNSIPPKY